MSRSRCWGSCDFPLRLNITSSGRSPPTPDNIIPRVINSPGTLFSLCGTHHSSLLNVCLPLWAADNLKVGVTWAWLTDLPCLASRSAWHMEVFSKYLFSEHLSTKNRPTGVPSIYSNNKSLEIKWRSIRSSRPMVRISLCSQHETEKSYSLAVTVIKEVTVAQLICVSFHSF